MGVVVDGCERFATRTAKWMLAGKIGKDEALERLQLFPKEHITLIGKMARKLKGLKPKGEGDENPPPGPAS